VPFSGVKLGAGLGERGGRLDGAAARRLGEAHRLQHQRQRPRDGGERLLGELPRGGSLGVDAKRRERRRDLRRLGETLGHLAGEPIQGRETSFGACTAGSAGSATRELQGKILTRDRPRRPADP